MKVETVKQVRIGGGEAQVLFVKEKHKKTRSETKFNETYKNDFISDGGLKEKSMKYYNSTTFNKTTVGTKSKKRKFIF
jgi:hypothetical protein